MLGLILSLLSAFLFGLNSVVMRRGLLIGEVYSSVLISLVFAVPYTVVVSLITGEIWALINLSTISMISFVVAGISNFLVVRYLIYAAIKLIGATVTFSITSCSTLVTVFLGIVLLKEEFSPKLIAAAMLVVVGVSLIMGRNASDKNGHGVVNFKRGILYAILAMLSVSVSSLAVRFGVLEANFPSLGLLVSNFSALIVCSTFLVLSKYKEEVLSIGVKATRYFLLGAFLVTTGQLMRYFALAHAPVSLASPIIDTYPLFTLALSYVFNRRLEVFDWRIILGTPLIVTALISIFI